MLIDMQQLQIVNMSLEDTAIDIQGLIASFQGEERLLKTLCEVQERLENAKQEFDHFYREIMGV